MEGIEGAKPKAHTGGRNMVRGAYRLYLFPRKFRNIRDLSCRNGPLDWLVQLLRPEPGEKVGEAGV